MDIFPAVLNLFVFALAIFGSACAELAPFFQWQFIHLFTGQDRSGCLKAYAILGLGVLASAVPSADLFSLAAANACQAINIGNTVVRKNAFDALNILTKANAAGLATHQAAIHATIDAALDFGQTGDGVFESAATLWFTIAFAFSWEVSADDAGKLQAQIKVPSGEDLGRSVDFARFAALMFSVHGDAIRAEVKRMGIRAFSRPEFFFGALSESVKAALLVVILDSGDLAREVLEITGFDQRAARLVCARVGL
jgi:hypothetical protein